MRGNPRQPCQGPAGGESLPVGVPFMPPVSLDQRPDAARIQRAVPATGRRTRMHADHALRTVLLSRSTASATGTASMVRTASRKSVRAAASRRARALHRDPRADRRRERLVPLLCSALGELASPGWLSFPRPGYTLALDFPELRRRHLALLDRLGCGVVREGRRRDLSGQGRAYERRLCSAVYPRWQRFADYLGPAVLVEFSGVRSWPDDGWTRNHQ